MQPSKDERGAILIITAIALFALVAFSAIVVDYGILWSARGQAQTSADAGALAGAIAIGKNAGNATSRVTASVVARQTPVWGQTTAEADVIVSSLPYPCPASAGGGSEGCIRVDVMRGAPDASGGAHTNALPVFFASMLGISQQGVRATATAQVTSGNSAMCIKPWGIADKWQDNSGTNATGWDQRDAFNPGVDSYIPPSAGNSTTGFTLANDRGMQMALKGDHGSWLAGWSSEIQFPGATGSSDYEAAIVGCPSFVPEVGFYAGQPCDNKDHEDPARGCLRVKQGVAQGPTTSGVATLVGMDRYAYWNGSEITGSDFSESPRIVPLPVFDPEDFIVNQASTCSGSNCVIKVVNILGFFVEGVCKDVEAAGRLDSTTYCDDKNKDIVGRLVSYIGSSRGGAGNVPNGNSFIIITRLVR